MTARSARFAAALLVGALAFGGVATSALVGSGNPTGRWATPGAIRTIILSPAGDDRLGVGVPPDTPNVVAEEAGVRVLSATVIGIPPSKLINGAQNFQLFEVHACTIYYFRGAHRYRAHFRWFTRRPPGGTITTRNRGGRIVVVRDNGAPYARDWNHPLSGPLANGRC
jgi:hypothetical protein